MFDTISQFLLQLEKNAAEYQPDSSRKKSLEKLADYISNRLQKDQPVALNFICTHNSRRSHLSQVWAQTIAAHYGYHSIYCFSGGTEATAVYPRVLDTLEHDGFEKIQLSEGKNPIYQLRFSPLIAGITLFSKTYGHAFNPSQDFAAIMTCSQADQGCPFVAGANARFSLPYDDPKESDGTEEEAKTYRERSHQIAADLFFVFKRLKHAGKTS